DSDDAGLRATFRAGDELLRERLRVSVATLPPGEDPDTLVRARGATGLEAVLRDAVDVLERKIQILERKGFFGSLPGRRRALDRRKIPAAPRARGRALEGPGARGRGSRGDRVPALSRAVRGAGRGRAGAAGRDGGAGVRAAEGGGAGRPGAGRVVRAGGELDRGAAPGAGDRQAGRPDPTGGAGRAAGAPG